MRENMMSRNYKKICGAPLFWALLVQICFLVWVLVFHVPYFETNDDRVMADIASGAYGGSQEYLVFINIIYGFFLHVLYYVIPTFNWYTVCELGLVFLSFTAIGYVLIQRMGMNCGRLAYVVLMGVFFPQFYLILQFTRIAILCCGAGYLLILWALESNGKKRWIIAGGGLVLVGSMLRMSGWKMATLFAAVLGLFSLISGLHENEEKKQKTVIKYMLVFLVLFAAVMGCDKFNSRMYARDTEWNQFREYTSIRASLTDRGWPSYAENQESYEALGVSENDFQLYTSANLGNEEMISMEGLKKIASLKEKREFSIQKEQKYFKTKLTEYSFLWIAVAAAGIFICFNRLNRNYLMLLMQSALFFGVITYYVYLERTIDRVIIPTFLLWICMELCCFDKKKYRQGIEIGTAQLSVVILCMGLMNKYYTEDYAQLIDKKVESKELYSLLSDKSSVFVADHRVFSQNNLFFDAYHVNTADFYSNQVPLGGWISRMPPVNAAEDALNIQSIPDALVEQKNVFFYTNYREEIVKNYLQEHSKYKEVAYSLYENAGKYKVISYCDASNSGEKPTAEDVCTVGGIGYSQEYEGYYELVISVKGEAAEKYLDGNQAYYVKILNGIQNVSGTFRLFMDQLWQLDNGDYQGFVIIDQSGLERLGLKINDDNLSVYGMSGVVQAVDK